METCRFSVEKLQQYIQVVYHRCHQSMWAEQIVSFLPVYEILKDLEVELEA